METLILAVFCIFVFGVFLNILDAKKERRRIDLWKPWSRRKCKRLRGDYGQKGIELKEAPKT